MAVVDRFSHSINQFFLHRVGILPGNTADTTTSSSSSTSSNGHAATAAAADAALSTLTLQDLLHTLDPQFLHSNVGVSRSPGARHPHDIPLGDFFSGRWGATERGEEEAEEGWEVGDDDGEEGVGMGDGDGDGTVVIPFRPPARPPHTRTRVAASIHSLPPQPS